MKSGEDDPLAIPPESARPKGKAPEAVVLHPDPAEPRTKKTTKETPDRHLDVPNGEVYPSLPEGPEPPDRHPTLGEPSATFDYHNAEGCLIGTVCHFETPNGKETRQLTLGHEDGKPVWEWRGFQRPAPLFGLHDLVARPDEAVFVHGDEEAASAACTHFPEHVHTTWPGDTNAVCNTDWSPLRGRRVLILPDADPAGLHAAEVIAEAVLAAGAAKVKIVEPLIELDPGANAANIACERGLQYAKEQITKGRIYKPQWDDLRPITWANLSQQPDREPLITGLLDRGALSLIHGESGVGKTFVTLDVAFHVVMGCPWHGHKVREGAAVYIDTEGGGIKKRLDALALQYPIEREAMRFYVLQRTVDLCRLDGDTEALIEAVRRIEDIELVVVDTVSRALAGGDENSARDMGGFVRNCDKLRLETGAHVLLVHHVGKDTTKGARGHSLLRAAVDTELKVTKSKDKVTLTVTKQRDTATGGPLAARLIPVEIGQDEDGEPITSAVLVSTEAPAERCKSEPIGQNKIALDLLRKALADAGEPAPASNHIPGHLKVVPLSLWRRYCYQGGLCGRDNDDARRKAFNRAKTNLQASGNIGVWDDHVWIAEGAGHAGHGGTSP